jgi:hypothetical protein
MKYYGSSDKLKDVFRDEKLAEKYQKEDVYFQFSLAIPTTIKRANYTASLLDINYDPLRFSDKTATVISYKVSRKHNVDTYNIRVKRGDIVFETSFISKYLSGTSNLYRIALRQTGEVELWAVDHWISSVKGDFFEVFKPVGPSDPEYVEITDDGLKRAKEASLPVPGGIGFYGQSFSTEKDGDRSAFGYLNLASNWVEADLIQKDFIINKERRMMAAMDVISSSTGSESEALYREQVQKELVLNGNEDNLREDL